MTLAFLFLAAFLSSIISGVFGMAGGITLLAAMTLVLPIQVIVPIHGAVQLTSNFSRAAILYKDIDLPIFRAFLFGAPLGGGVGYLLLSRMERPEWAYGLIALMLLYTAFKPKKIPGIQLSLWGFTSLGFVASTLGCILGATGPVLVPFFIRKDLSNQAIVATKAACQILVHLVKIPVFGFLAFSYSDHFGMIFCMGVAVILGTKIGTKLLSSLPREKFLFGMRVLMFLIALRLIYRLYF